MISRRFDNLNVKPNYWVGVLLCCVGILCNQWVLTRLFSSDGTLEFETQAEIWFFNIGLVLLGLFLIWYSCWASSVEALRYWLQNYPRTTASAFGLAMAVGLSVFSRGVLLCSESD